MQRRRPTFKLERMGADVRTYWQSNFMRGPCVGVGRTFLCVSADPIVPRTCTRFGDRSFPASGPRIWNSLPPELRWPDTELGEFRGLLKTFLFA